LLRFVQFVILALGLSLVALASAILTMRFAIHGSEVTIPSFKGLTAEEALSKAASLGVGMTIDNRFYSADVPAGRILAQSPAAGTVVRREWHVRATESLGPQLVQIPNLVGQPQRAASIQIRRLGLELGGVAQLPSDAAVAGTVIAQDPQAGAAGVEKPSINLVVGVASSAGVDGFVMPDLVGQPYAAAAAIVAAAGLKIVPPSKSAPGRASVVVVDQEPAAGYKMDRGAEVQVRVQ
jgi:beta-lactam-binding protein with PASTA domain